MTRDRVYIRSDGGREELYDLLHDDLESVDLARYPQSRRILTGFAKSSAGSVRRDHAGSLASRRLRIALDTAPVETFIESMKQWSNSFYPIRGLVAPGALSRSGRH